MKIKEYANEYQLHKAVVQWLQLQYPNILFRSDLGGVKLSIGLATKMKALNPVKGYPDMFIIESTKYFKGLFIEIKLKGFKEFKKDGITYVSDYVEEQAEYLLKLRQRGYCAVFGRGFDEIKIIIDNYFANFNYPNLTGARNENLFPNTTNINLHSIHRISESCFYTGGWECRVKQI